MPKNALISKPSRPLPASVAVIGAGTIGPDIGYYLKSALPDLTLHLVDVAQAQLDRAAQRFKDYASKAVTRGKMSAQAAERVTAGVNTTLDYDAIAAADWVIEAATEDLDLKRRIFARVEQVVRPDALITSNTSSLPAARIFSDLRNKSRATVTHFFAPAWRNPIVEVIRWGAAEPAVLDYLSWVFTMTGKVPLVTDDVPCFMLDRIFDNWCNEAALLLDRATAAEIDTTVSEFVHGGPFFVLNMARGNPIITETNTLQADEEGEHYRPAPVFRSVDTWQTVAPGKRVEVAERVAGEIRDRMLGILISQATDIVDRDIGAASDLELGCRLALGFKRGPLETMHGLGNDEVERITGRLAVERPGLPLPRRPIAAYQGTRRYVLVDDVDGVRVITMRRPEALNALHDELTDDILDAIREVEDKAGTAGFVITGYGPRAFCAGADIGRFPRLLGDAAAAAEYARECSRLLVHIDRMRKPVVAALNGFALGGGLELAIRCHGRVAMRSAWMQLPEITLGIVPGIGAMVVPYRRWPGAATAFHDLLRGAETLSAEKAKNLGVVDALTEDHASLYAAALAHVRALADRVTPPADAPVKIEPFRRAKAVAASGQPISAEVASILETAVIEAASAATLAAALEVGYRAFGVSACTAAAREGIAAFQEGRKPDFVSTG